MENKKNLKVFIEQGLIFSVLIVLILFFAISTEGKFIKIANLHTVLSQVVPYALLGFGMTFVMISGGIDLSVGSILGFGGILCAKLITLGFSVPVAITISLISGAFVGFINGFCVAKLKVVPFITTLGTQYIFRGITQLIGDGKPVSIQSLGDNDLTNQFKFIGNGTILGVSVPIWIMLITAFILMIILNKTSYAKSLYAVGSNEEAAKFSGIKVEKTKILAYVISGITASLAGILLTAKLVSAQTNAGTGYELEGVAAAVIGGTSVNGGSGSILGTLIGALVMGVLRNGLNILKVDSFIQMVIIGVIIILGVWYDRKRADNINKKEG